MGLTSIQKSIRTGFASFVAVCAIASGLVLTTQTAHGQDAKPLSAKMIQQGGTADEAQKFLGQAPYPQPAAAKHTSTQKQPSYLISPAQDEAISNALIAFIFLVLPAGVALALWRQEKRDRKQSLTLNDQIEMLERIWRKSPQYPRHE